MPTIKDAFSKFAKTMDSPIDDAFVITPSDTADGSADLVQPTRAIYIATTASGTTANVVCVFHNKAGSNTSLAIANLQVGVVYPFRVKRIGATGTTATQIIGLI
jgi:hypothetical protein